MAHALQAGVYMMLHISFLNTRPFQSMHHISFSGPHLTFSLTTPSGKVKGRGVADDGKRGLG